MVKLNPKHTQPLKPYIAEIKAPPAAMDAPRIRPEIELIDHFDPRSAEQHVEELLKEELDLEMAVKEEHKKWASTQGGRRKSFKTR